METSKTNQSGCGLGAKLGPICVKSKETGISNWFCSYFTWAIPFKVKSSVLQTPEWKFKANIARNSMFEGCLGPNLYLIWV